MPLRAGQGADKIISQGACRGCRNGKSVAQKLLDLTRKIIAAPPDRAFPHRARWRGAIVDRDVLARQLEELEARFAEDTEALKLKYEPESIALETIEIRPRKSDIQVDLMALAWTPWLVGADGIAERAF